MHYQKPRNKIPGTRRKGFSPDTIYAIETPEARIWPMVLQRAIEDARLKERSIKSKCKQADASIKSRRIIKKNAMWWLFESKLDGIGSLKWICENFNLDIEYIRKFATECING